MEEVLIDLYQIHKISGFLRVCGDDFFCQPTRGPGNKKCPFDASIKKNE